MVDGSVIQSSWGNQVRDNFNASPNGLATAAGQLFYATATGTLVALGPGATNTVLQVVGGVPVWVVAPTVAALQSQNLLDAGGVLARGGAFNATHPGGVELIFQAGTGYVQSTRRDTATLLPLVIQGQPVNVNGPTTFANTVTAPTFVGNLQGAASTVTLATVEASLGANTTLGNLAYADLCSVALAAGTWLVIGTVLVDATATSGGLHVTAARLRNATAGTVLQEVDGSTGGSVNWFVTLVVTALVTLGAGATIALASASTSTAMRALALAMNVGAGIPGVPGTHLCAVKIG